jgi:EAL domain-containing protein (putative c-di-GMP-specific phosphodiesterase class I)
MLRLRVTYQEILAHLGPRGAGLNRNNLSRWKKTGYLVWLAEQQRREDAKVQLELLFDLVQEKDNAKLHEATQQIAALRISQVLAAFDINTLTTAFQQHPQSFVRLLQTLPSLGRAGMDCERLLVELAERKATLDPAAKKRRGLPEESMQYITQKINLM